MADETAQGPHSDDPDRPDTERPRGGNGRFVRDPETAKRDAEAARLRARGMTFRQICDEMGYASTGSAHDAVQRCLKAIVEEPAKEVRQLELERLDAMFSRAMDVLDRDHAVTSGGKVVYDVVEWATDDEGNIKMDEDGRPLAKKVVRLRDSGPELAAIKTLLLIQERRARLLGLDSPVKADFGGKLTYEIAGVDLSALK